MIVSCFATRPDGSMGIGYGLDPAGNVVTFAGDWRPMRDIAQAIAETGERVDVHVDDWQLLCVRPAFEVIDEYAVTVTP